MTIINNTFSVVIGATDYTNNVISINRKVDLCNPGQTFVVELDPHGTYPTLTTYQSVTIQENGVTVLTGYTSDIIYERTPNKITVKGSDTYKRCQDTFIDDTVKTNGETVAYWITYLCALAGVSYSVDGTGSGLAVYGDIPLGLKTVGDALTTIANYAGWVILVYPDGVVHFTNIGSVTDRVFYTLKGARSTGDTDTRTTAIVWGMSGTNYQESRAVTGSGSGRVMVLADPMITDTSTAKMIATYLLNQFANLDDNLTIDILGYPSITVGQVASLDFGGSYTNTITNIESNIDVHGYRMSVTMGRKCLNMAAVTPAQGVVYAGTEYYLARSYNFYSSGSTIWQDIWNNGSGSRSGLECFALDNYRPSSYGYASGSFGIVRTTNLAGSPPDWSVVHSPTQFNTAVGDKLWSVTNVRSATSQGLLYAQALSTSGSIWVGKSLDYGSTWSWGSALDITTSASVASSVPSLGFATRGINEVWSTGNSGSLLYCSTGSSGLNFNGIYTVPNSLGIINNIVTGGSNIYIGGSQFYAPYTAPQYQTAVYSTSGVTNPNNVIGAPDGNYAVISPGGILSFENIRGATFHNNYHYVRLYASTPTTGSLQLDNGGGNTYYTFSGTQSPTSWIGMLLYPGSEHLWSILNVGTDTVSIDAIEHWPGGAVKYRNGAVTLNGYSGRGSFISDGHWKFTYNDYNAYVTFFLDNIYLGAEIELSITCIYEPYPIPTFFASYVFDLAGSYVWCDNGNSYPINNGETRIYFTRYDCGTQPNVRNGSMGFGWTQGMSRSGEYQINYIKVDGVEVFVPNGYGYVKRSTVSSGSAFVDITPKAGGAVYLRGLSATDNNPSSALAVGVTSGSVVGTDTSGSSWTVNAGAYSYGNNLSQNGYNYKRNYWLDDNGVYYSGDFLTTVQSKTGNWQDVYGYSFLNSGKKKVLVAQAVQ